MAVVGLLESQRKGTREDALPVARRRITPWSTSDRVLAGSCKGRHLKSDGRPAEFDEVGQEMAVAEKRRFTVAGAGEVSALLLRPADAKCILALAHGAGAGMSHPFMSALAEELARVGVATLRYQFPYMEARRRRPDAPNVAVAAVAAAVKAAEEAATGLPLVAGGK